MKPCKILFLLMIVICVTFSACSSDDQPFTTPTQPDLTISISVSPSIVRLTAGQTTQQFTATVEAPLGLPQTVRWRVQSHQIGASINANGLLTVASNVEYYFLNVFATSTFDTSQSGIAMVNPLSVGDIGPGGGYVFYFNRFGFEDGWRFLEAAPASSEFTAAWGLDGIAALAQAKE